MTAHALRYDRPAEEWVEALQIGNGRLGAMCFGGALGERLQINDGTAWSGSPRSENAGEPVDAATAAECLRLAREAIDAGRYADAVAPLQRLQHRYSQSYLPFADLVVTVSGGADAAAAVTDYTRTLDLPTATHTVDQRLDGHRLTRSAFSSRPAGVLVYELRSEAPDGIDVSLELSSPLRVIGAEEGDAELSLSLQMPSDVAPLHDAMPEPVTYNDEPGSSLRGAVVLGWVHDGVATGAGSGRGIRTATIVLATETTFRGIGVEPGQDVAVALAEARGRVRAALATEPAELRAAQRADHAELYDRVSVETGLGTESAKPLDVRLAEANRAPGGVLAADPELAGLLFNFGRYLLICSSRDGGVPSTLQGIWNDSLQPPWSSNYTTNINVEMNYWQANVANLAETLPPLFDLIDALADRGRETANRLYGARGWVAHHNTDAWAYTQPVGLGHHDPKWAFWPMAGLWLVRHLWERLEFGADDTFARERVWPPLRSAAEFALSWLVERPDGLLGTNPSTSPENVFADGSGVEGSVASSSALDLVLIADVLDAVAEVAARLGLDGDPVVAEAATARARLAAPHLGRGGRIAEWDGDFADPDPTHRHLSPLYFVYPGDWPVSPEQAAAVSATLDSRGDESTGWSLVWKLALRARLGQPERVDDLLRLVFRDMSVDRGEWVGGLYPNLFAAHPPFQIDGNLGYVAGLAECVLQSHRGAIELLPAIPPSLGTGRARGLVARSGVAVDVAWQPGDGAPELTTVTLTALTGSARGAHRVVWREAELSIELGDDPVRLTVSDFINSSH